MASHRFCRQPDRHEPALVCGYPLPCPHHTAVVDVSGPETKIEVPPGQARHTGKLVKVAKVLRSNRR
jgi:hypothetical protein